MEEKILTKHPQGKRGFRISKNKYETIRRAIRESLRGKGDLTHTELTRSIQENPAVKLQGYLEWYVEVVKLDLEARKEIERVSNVKPPVYRLRGR